MSQTRVVVSPPSFFAPLIVKLLSFIEGRWATHVYKYLLNGRLHLLPPIATAVLQNNRLPSLIGFLVTALTFLIRGFATPLATSSVNRRRPVGVPTAKPGTKRSRPAPFPVYCRVSSHRSYCPCAAAVGRGQKPTVPEDWDTAFQQRASPDYMLPLAWCCGSVVSSIPFISSHLKTNRNSRFILIQDIN